MNKYFVAATSLLAGTIIGAGIFSLPFVFSIVGFGVGAAYLVFFGAVYFAVHFMYARVLEVNSGEHQFFYLSKKYLPRAVSNVASFSVFLELIFVLTTYLILASVFLNTIIELPALLALFIFWFLGSIFIFAHLEWLGWAEILGMLGIIGIVGFVIYLSVPREFITPFVGDFGWVTAFLPFGPLLFAFSGRPAVSAVIKEYKKARAVGKSFSVGLAIFLGTAIPAAVYFFFTLGVLKLNPFVTPETLNSLGTLSNSTQALLGVFGLIALWTSYFIIGINVRDIMRVDLRRPKIEGAAVVLIAPLLLYALGFQNFLPAVSFIGSVFLALEGIFIVMMWRKAFPKNPLRLWSILLYAVFVIALGYEVAMFFNII